VGGGGGGVEHKPGTRGNNKSAVKQLLCPLGIKTCLKTLIIIHLVILP